MEQNKSQTIVLYLCLADWTCQKIVDTKNRNIILLSFVSNKYIIETLYSYQYCCIEMATGFVCHLFTRNLG